MRKYTRTITSSGGDKTQIIYQSNADFKSFRQELSELIEDLQLPVDGQTEEDGPKE